jgi:hypothetical protein
MSDNVIVPCPHCAQQCAIAPAHMSRLLACPHCAREFVPSGGGGGAAPPPPPRRDSERRSGPAPRARHSNNNQSLLLIGGVVVLLVLFVGFMASSGGDSRRKRRTRSKPSGHVSVVEESMPGGGSARPGSGSSGGPMVHPDESISLQTAESGTYRVNGNVYDTLMSVRVWKDPHALSQGKRAGRIAHDDIIEVLGKATNKNGVLVYKVRGKYKGGSSTCEGYVSAFYIEKDYKVIAEHNWKWMDHDELQRRGKE